MDKFYIYGRNAVLEALNSDAEIEKIYLEFGDQGPIIDKIKHFARKAGIPVTVYDKKKFQNLEKTNFPPGTKTQGIIALRSLVKLLDLSELIENSFEHHKYPVIVALDEINDPHNLGAIARSVECSGAYGMILPERNSAPITPAALKTSAGALEKIQIAKVGNLSNALEKLKDAGFWIIGTEMETKETYYGNHYDRPIILVIGNEGKGMRGVIKKACDIIIKIPMAGKLNSLNASVSAGIILFEILKQRSENQ